MTEKDKAKDLYEKFLPIVRKSDMYDTYYNKAKAAARIVCDEALKICNLMDGGFSFEKEIDFWRNVKLEIDHI